MQDEDKGVFAAGGAAVVPPAVRQCVSAAENTGG